MKAQFRRFLTLVLLLSPLLATSEDGRISEVAIADHPHPTSPSFSLINSGEGGMGQLSGLLPEKAFSICGEKLTFRATVLKRYYSETRNYLAAIDVLTEDGWKERLFLNVDAIAELPILALGHLNTFLRPGAVRTFRTITCGNHAYELWPYSITK